MQPWLTELGIKVNTDTRGVRCLATDWLGKTWDNYEDHPQKAFPFRYTKFQGKNRRIGGVGGWYMGCL